jgi:hypothetical protein
VQLLQSLALWVVSEEAEFGTCLIAVPVGKQLELEAAHLVNRLNMIARHGAAAFPRFSSSTGKGQVSRNLTKIRASETNPVDDDRVESPCTLPAPSLLRRHKNPYTSSYTVIF